MKNQHKIQTEKRVMLIVKEKKETVFVIPNGMDSKKFLEFKDNNELLLERIKNVANSMNWITDKDSSILTKKIVQKFLKIVKTNNFPDKFSAKKIQLDILQYHLNICKIDLQKFLGKDDNYLFVHNVIGIMKNLNKTKGEVKNGFVCNYDITKHNN